MNRREFIQYASALGISAALAESLLGTARAQTNSAHATPSVSGRVVVVGGGMAGATAAKYLRLRGGEKLQVTLVERMPKYLSHTMSNLVLNGRRTMPSLEFAYTDLARNYGINVIQGEGVGVDANARTVKLADGKTLPYDRLVLSPGLQFDAPPGLTTADFNGKFPHAWDAGPQTTNLRNQLLNLRDGGTVIIASPPMPYRCPPGPYERSSVIGHWLLKNKPGAKVILLDANPKIVVEEPIFTGLFEGTLKDVVTRVPSAAIKEVDPATMTVKTSAGDFKGDIINIIPPSRAGKIVQDASLVNVSERWAGVDVHSMESKVAPGIHVVGDSTQLPKTGTYASSEAKNMADAIVRLMRGQEPLPSPVITTACYTPISEDLASWLTFVQQYDPETKGFKQSSTGMAHEPSQVNYKRMFDWFDALMRDSFA